MQQQLETIKLDLIRRVPREVRAVVDTLKKQLPPFSARFKELIVIVGWLQELEQQIMGGTIDSEAAIRESNRIRKAVLDLIDQLDAADFQETSDQMAPEQYRRGKILYRIPARMQVGAVTNCLVRIAFTEELLRRDLAQRAGDQIREVRRVSEIMSVELIDPNDTAPFQIRSISETIQFIDQDDYTEWQFWITPRIAGAFLLLLKVSVIEIVNGRERKRDIVLQERIEIVADGPIDPPDELPYKEAPETLPLIATHSGEASGQKALLEIMDTDQPEFTALAREAGLRPRAEGTSSGLDGSALLAYSLRISPAVQRMIRALLLEWLQRRKNIRIRAGGMLIEADAPDELERIMQALTRQNP